MDLRNRSIAVIGALSLVVALSACSGGATPTPQADAEAAVCTALQVWSDEMREFVALDASTATADDVAAQRDVVTAAWDDVKSSMTDVESADAAAVEAGWATLEEALKDIPTDVPVADAIAGVKAAAEPLKATYKEMADGMGCKIATPY